MHVEVICFATNRTPGLHNWEASCRRFGYATQVLGLGERWKGYLTKIKGYLNYLQNSPSNRLYIITDAYDVMACRQGNLPNVSKSPRGQHRKRLRS